jgi:hypothetical protein
MKLTPPASSNPGSQADASDVYELQRRLSEASEALTSMADDVGHARQIREFSSDQRKRILAVAAASLIKAGASSAAANTEAMAGEPYKAALKQLANEFEAAEIVLARWESTKIKWECCRSLLAMNRESVKQL